IVFASSAPFAVRLYGDLRTDLRELLPQGAPAAAALEELEKRIGGLSSLAVVVRTADLKAGERFVDALAARIRKLPRNMVARVYYKIDEEKAFFDAHGALYADLKDLAQVRDVLRSRIGYGGEVRGVIESQDNLVRDLLVSSVLVLTAVSLALILYYRSWRSIPLLVLPLFTGVAVTFAISRWTIHYLNPNTAFLGSIIVGNGINAGIILLARYFEERRRGNEVEQALPCALKTTWVATFAASAAAAASYGSLGAVSFRGFNQFGFMGTAGMLLCWVTTYLLMPPLIAIAERVRPLRERKRSRIIGWVAGPYATALTHHTGWVIATSALIVAGSVWGMWRFVRQPIQYDFRQLGSRKGLTEGAAYWDSHVDAVLQSYQTPTVVLTDSPEKAQAVAAAIEEVRVAQAPRGTIDSVATLQKLVPDQQPRKIELLREIFRLVAPPKGRPGLVDERIARALPEDLRPALLRLRERTELRPIALAEVPTRLKL